MKSSSIFVCKECGYEAAKWMGKCTACESWNSFIEEKIVKGKSPVDEKRSVNAHSLNEISLKNEERIDSGSEELNRVLGGGIVKGSLVLCGGEPGIGKSTLLLQVCKTLSKSTKVLYVTGEESEKQIKIRSERIGVNEDSLLVTAETDIDIINEAIKNIEPSIVVIDSIQTMYSTELSSVAGSVSQVRECTMRLIRIAKEKGITFFIVGHVTKEGSIAGPRVLEHMVDCVLYFEGERHQSYRILRAVKNRYGSTNEIGVFEMMDRGLVDVANPSSMLLSGRPVDVPGSAIICSVEGTRPILAEIQALVSSTSFAMPKRMATGVDYNRVNLLMTVLEKRLGLKLGDQDAYINVTGGIKLDETATDLAIACAVVSSFKNIPLPADMVFFGEVGLTGEVRTVSQAERRLNEIKKMGFKKCMLPFDCLGAIAKQVGIELIAVKNLSDAFNYIR